MATESFDQFSGNSYGRWWTGKASCRIENEWILPDYKEAAQRLYRVDVDPRITEKKLYRKGQEFVCEIEGAAYLQVLYQPEGEGGEESVSSFSARENFFYTFHVPVSSDDVFDPDEIAVLCEGEADDVNARLLGPRRLGVRCSVELTLDLSGNRKLTEAQGVEEELERLTTEIPTTIYTGSLRREFRLHEILSLPAEYLPIRELIDLNFSLFADQVKTTDGNIDFTGHLMVNAAYAPEGDTGVISFIQPLEFEKTVGEATVREGDLCEISLVPTSVNTETGMGENGEIREITLDVLYDAEICLFRSMKTQALLDVYSLEHESTVATEEIAVQEIVAIRDLSREVKTEMPLRHASFVRAEDVRANLTFQDSYRESDKLMVRADLTLRYLAVAENGTLFAAEDSGSITFDLSENVPLPETNGKVEIIGGVSDADLVCGDDTVQIRIGVYGRVTVSREEKLNTVSEIRLGETFEKKASGLLFYYPDGEETLWEICKKNHAGIREVRQENHLEDDTVPEVVRIIRK